jgi:hypothetical protein
MAHYAQLDADNVVIAVFVGRNEDEVVGGISDWEEYYKAKRCSYNTHAGEHALGGIPFRKNYPEIGFTYDPDRDAFIPPKPFPSWVLNEDTCLWDAPVPYPDDGKVYAWNEEDVAWEEVIDG